MKTCTHLALNQKLEIGKLSVRKTGQKQKQAELEPFPQNSQTVNANEDFLKSFLKYIQSATPVNT